MTSSESNHPTTAPRGERSPIWPGPPQLANPRTQSENGWSGTTHITRSTGADRSAGIWLGAAVIAMGLLAGLVYDWSIAVMPALTAADDRTLVDAMQQTVE